MKINLNFLGIYLRTLAAKAIVATEQAAIDYYLQNGQKLRDKGEFAINYAMNQYAKATANVPILNTSTWDDEYVRSQLQVVMAQVWAELDDRIKQAAREVTNATQ